MRKPSEIKIGDKTLDAILEEHKHNPSYIDLRGADLSGADLSGADLRGADFSGADLYGADFSKANLHGADLRWADLSRADLREAYLREADLREAYLREADLSRANLCGAYLCGAYLREAYLCGAYLREAYLCGADFSDADLSSANLCGADLSGADLSGTCLREAKNFIVPHACPDTGSFIGWKKAFHIDLDQDHIPLRSVLVKLEIPEDAKRLSATGRKCRCDKARVISIESIDGLTKYDEANSGYDHGFIYCVGEVVKVDDFDEDRWNECSTGIHFFINRCEAENYGF